MGLFDKKYCDICGNKIGVLGNRKLSDGNLCKDCAKKLSPFFSERRHSSVEDIRGQLAYREDNKKAVANFYTTLTYGDSGKLLIDENARKFMISKTNSIASENPDVVDFSQVTSCELDIDENRRELKRKDPQGNMVSYNPARYEYYYNFDLKLNVNHPYFDEMTLRLNSHAIETGERDMSGRNRFSGSVYGNSARAAAINGVLGALSGQSGYGGYGQGYSEYERYVQMGDEIRNVLMGGGRMMGGGYQNNMNGGYGQNMMNGGYGDNPYMNNSGMGAQNMGAVGAFGGSPAGNVGAFGNAPAGNMGAYGNNNFNNPNGMRGANPAGNAGAFGNAPAGNAGAFGVGAGFGGNQGTTSPIRSAAGPVTCPVCGAKTTPDASGCCEYCGSRLS